jgi:hypothetical protein
MSIPRSLCLLFSVLLQSCATLSQQSLPGYEWEFYNPAHEQFYDVKLYYLQNGQHIEVDLGVTPSPDSRWYAGHTPIPQTVTVSWRTPDNVVHEQLVSVDSGLGFPKSDHVTVKLQFTGGKWFSKSTARPPVQMP